MIPEKIKSIYLIAICGTGMASLAGLLKEAGYDVTGSDNNIYPPMSTLLESKGIPIKPGFKEENITEEYDLVIVGNAVSKTNEEVQAVLTKEIPYTSFPSALAHFFLKDRKSLVVTGTHGKTTTTALLSWVLHSCGEQPGFMVGGWMKNFDGNHCLPNGEYFVTEGDEYDTAFFDKGPKFLHYQPYAAILTGIEFDHADIFTDLEHIKSAFFKFVTLVDPKGILLVEHTTPYMDEIRKRAQTCVESYGFEEEADWKIHQLKYENGEARFSLSRHGKLIGEFQLPMIGKHNTLNAAAVVALCHRLGIPAEAINQGFKTFKGIKRRQEVVGVQNRITVMDDFAHHPTAVHLTVEAVKLAYPESRVWAVFEPRSATSRRNVFQNTFPDSFRLADKVIIAGLFAPEKIPEEERLNPKTLVTDIEKTGPSAYFIPSVDDIILHIHKDAQPGDVILIMSCGGFSEIHQKLLKRLEQPK